MTILLEMLDWVDFTYKVSRIIHHAMRYCRIFIKILPVEREKNDCVSTFGVLKLL